MPAFVGRTEPLARLSAAYHALVRPPGGEPSGWAGLVLVTGEAGIGKTALLKRFADGVTREAGIVVWGTCWDGDQAPAWWPWTQALRGLLEQRADLSNTARPELAAIVPELVGVPSGWGADADAAARMRVFDAAGQVLRRVADDAPVVVILDDLHWADSSTVDLLRFLAHQRQPGAVLLIGAYRPDELHRGVASTLSDLATGAELVPLQGLVSTRSPNWYRPSPGRRYRTTGRSWCTREVAATRSMPASCVGFSPPRAARRTFPTWYAR